MKRRLVPDFTLLALALALSVFGIAMVYSAGQTDVLTRVTSLWHRQALWFGMGLVAAYLASRASIRMLDWITPYLYAATCFVLLLLVFIGKGFGTGASTKSWLAIGGFRLGQPSEIAKIVVVLMLAKVLAARRDAPKSLFDLWQPALVVGVPWMLIMLQPDLGTGLVFIGIFFAMLFWSGCSWQLLVLVASAGISLVLAVNTTIWGAWFVMLVGLVLWYKPYVVEGVLVILANVAMGGIAPLVWEKLNPYQQRRLLVFLDPGSDPLRSGYHVIQSQVAIGSGGWFGKGFTMGTQKRLAFLPA
ncbi:MAG TPA: FtsW/RodA/SpoVE family cell cycle protein, partial [Gemmatimonadaceae bacterium]|nr:FtsW/RodA/SpoVE family cell cycle protein [Gemmatimonadaceae bacterium]